MGALYRLARGVRLRPESGGESASLLVPEGIVSLNDSAAAALALADGTRDVPSIVAALRERFEDLDGALSNDVGNLFDDLAERGFLTR